MENTRDFLPKTAENRAINETKQCGKCGLRKEVREFASSVSPKGKKRYARNCLICGGKPTGDSYSQPYRPKEKRAKKFKEGFETPLGLLLLDLIKFAKDMARCEGSAIACQARGDRKTAKGRWVGFYINKERADHTMRLIIQNTQWIGGKQDAKER